MKSPAIAFVARLLVLLPAAFAVAAQSPSSPVLRMERSVERSFGLVVGDLLRSEVLLEVEHPWQLDEPSLEGPGVKDYWIDLIEHAVTRQDLGDRTRYRIRQVWQTFYFNRETKALDVPRGSVRLLGGAEPLLLELPPFEFTTSPLHETAGLRRDEDGFYLRPDSAPAVRDATGHQQRALAFLVLALLPLAWLGWRAGWSGRPRPFARAWRKIRRPVRDVERLTALREGMLSLHRALNEAAGVPLFQAALSRFIAMHPGLAEAQPLIERFFADSHAVFFGTQEAANHATEERLEALRVLARRLAHLEARS
jgi:mxaA protein